MDLSLLAVGVALLAVAAAIAVKQRAAAHCERHRPVAGAAAWLLAAGAALAGIASLVAGAS